MKKIILTATAVFALSFANAQDVKFGAKAGINIASIGGDSFGYDINSKVGIQIGGFAEIKVSDQFAIQPELLFSSQGAKSKISEPDYKEENTLNLSYLNIPIMVKYYLADKLSLEAGPQIGFLLSAKNKYTITDTGVTESGTDDAKADFKSIDFGLNFGAGYDFTDNVSAGIRYNIGLSNINKESILGSNHNGVFSLALGYKF